MMWNALKTVLTAAHAKLAGTTLIQRREQEQPQNARVATLGSQLGEILSVK